MSALHFLLIIKELERKKTEYSEIKAVIVTRLFNLLRNS